MPFYTHFVWCYACTMTVAYLGYLAIFVTSFRYYIPLLSEIQQKSFHYILFGLILIATVLLMAGFAFAQSMFSKLRKPGVTDNDIIAEYRGFKFCVALWISITGLAHAIFVLKYWLLSRKIKNIKTGNANNNLERTHNIILTSLIVLIVISCALEF